MTVEKSFLIYFVFEIILAVVSVLGNALVIVAFIRDRRLRTRTNLYIFSLAITDILTSAVAVPLYVHSMMTLKPRDFYACLYVHTLILTFCTVSILHLIAVSYDRYMAIVWRKTATSHERGMRHATILIASAWILGIAIGCLPLMGWHSGVPTISDTPRCEFMKVIRMSYLIFLFYVTIVSPTAVMIFFYSSIYYTVRKHHDRMLCVRDSSDTGVSRVPYVPRERTATDHSGQGLESKPMKKSNQGLRQRREAKVKRVIISLAIVIICFFVAWYPLYIMNAIVYYCEYCHIEMWWFYVPIILSHISSAINPFIYARTMPGYKDAFLEALACKKQSVDQGTKKRGFEEALELRRNNEESDEEVEDIKE